MKMNETVRLGSNPIQDSKQTDSIKPQKKRFNGVFLPKTTILAPLKQKGNPHGSERHAEGQDPERRNRLV